jgi:acyl-CoA dehydrogenase
MNISQLEESLRRFVVEECQPAEAEFESHMASRTRGTERWSDDAIPPCITRLKGRAQQLGLWNLFLGTESSRRLIQSSSWFHHLSPHLLPSFSISNAEYAVLSEIMGHSFLAPEACNCSAPDTGNMEVLLHYASQEQQLQYLIPLMQGQIRSAFLMTEPDVASSDATNIQTTLTKFIQADGAVRYTLQGKKWWSTGAMDPRCRVCLVLARTNSPTSSAPLGIHQQHTLVLVPSHKITLVRPLQVFGYDDAPHGHAECQLNNIILQESDIILGEGRGFEIAQGRLGPGRIHHCMRAIGMASRCYQLMIARLCSDRKTFGQYLYQHGACGEMIADSVQDLTAARLLTLHCAQRMDTLGAKAARKEIALIKVAVPQLTLQVVDRAIQVYGAAGLCQDYVLAKAFCSLRSLRIADGPDAIHKRTVALMEIARERKQGEEEQKRKADANQIEHVPLPPQSSRL